MQGVIHLITDGLTIEEANIIEQILRKRCYVYTSLKKSKINGASTRVCALPTKKIFIDEQIKHISLISLNIKRQKAFLELSHIFPWKNISVYTPRIDITGKSKIPGSKWQKLKHKAIKIGGWYPYFEKIL